eukprot:TRINITY_DN1225_c0_g1_i1.p2 TRINITY_DN1225_c0_g1~~TRINITY_DN1225_c0_g1_i1.p2  ORF type:complete len:209 (+),score=48.07 TRINITY_DN1225_c0_g1_i1:1111-1737(+)
MNLDTKKIYNKSFMSEEIKKEVEAEEPKEEEKKEVKELKGDFTVTTSDGKDMTGNFETLSSSGFIKHYYTNVAPSTTDKVALPRVSSTSFERINQFYGYYKGKTIPKINKPLTTNKLPDLIKDEWTLKFIDLPNKDLCDLLSATSFLQLEDLKQLAACVIATRLFGKTREELRKEFQIDPEITPEQDKELDRFFYWADQLWPQLRISS